METLLPQTMTQTHPRPSRNYLLVVDVAIYESVAGSSHALQAMLQPAATTNCGASTASASRPSGAATAGRRAATAATRTPPCATEVSTGLHCMEKLFWMTFVALSK